MILMLYSSSPELKTCLKDWRPALVVPVPHHGLVGGGDPRAGGTDSVRVAGSAAIAEPERELVTAGSRGDVLRKDSSAGS